MGVVGKYSIASLRGGRRSTRQSSSCCNEGWIAALPLVARNDGENRTPEQGHALITALLILIVMNLMAIGIMQVSLKMSKSASFKTIDSEVFHVTDSCNDEVITWLKNQTSAPTTMPTFSKSDINFMLTGSETTAIRNLLTGYNYNCTLQYLLSGAPDGSQAQNTGNDVGGNTGYGSTGALSQKYYYKIVSTGGGPKNSVRIINTIVSVEY